MYISDYDSRFPKRSYQVAGTPGCSGKHFWPRVVAPYIGTGDGASSSGKALWRCPSYRELVQNWYCGAYADYALNGYIEGRVDSEIPYSASTPTGTRPDIAGMVGTPGPAGAPTTMTAMSAAAAMTTTIAKISASATVTPRAVASRRSGAQRRPEPSGVYRSPLAEGQ
jgi:hypothetical protein